MKKLSKKEKLFAFFWGMGAQPQEACRQAGLEGSGENLLRLLEDAAVREEIRRWQKRALQRSGRAAARRGLEKLAFGGVGDALSLAFREELPSPQELAQMDLSAISEIKHPKGGGCEIKLVDRLKALELLSSLPEPEEEGGLSRLMKALDGNGQQLDDRLFQQDGEGHE